MKLVDLFFYTPKVKRFILDIIKDYDRKEYHDLTYADKCAFSSLLIETAGKNSEEECITQSNDLDQIIYFLRKSLLGNHISEQNLISSMKNAAIGYYENIMEALFNRVMEDYEQDQSEWNRYVANYGDPDDLYDRKRSGL